MPAGNQDWKYVQNGKPNVVGGEKPREQRTSSQQVHQQPRPQRQHEETGAARRGPGGSYGQQYLNQNQQYSNQQQQTSQQNGFRPQPKTEYLERPATDSESIAQVIKEGVPEQVQTSLLELINQGAEIDQKIVALSDQVVQKGSQYLSLEAKLKSSMQSLSEAKVEREKTVSDLNNQLQNKTQEVVDLLQQLQRTEQSLETLQHENQVRERELTGASKQLDEAVRKLTMCEEGLRVKEEELTKAQTELEKETSRVEEIERQTRSAEEQVQQLKINLGHKDFQNYQMVDKIRGMELHFQNQYACWNKDRQNLEQELHRLKGLTSDLLPFGNEAGNADPSKPAPPGFGGPLPGLKLHSEEDLLSVFSIVIAEGRANAKPWTGNEEAMVDNLLQPFKWSENYANKYGCMVDFIRSHNAVFKEREEDGWLYRAEGVLSLPPQLPGMVPGMLPPLPPPGFPTSNGLQSLLMMPMFGKVGNDLSSKMMDDISNPMMQFMVNNNNNNNNMPFPPMLVTPLAPQKPPQSCSQVQMDGDKSQYRKE
eukprot:TRINITY_DN2876_c1_g1_i11.p1 TRINITY_DN2876_c1_g1~~TRINITY_DN2876_c1_g1_i11.p1  ORF type:complete len:537 (-),score=99.25 TRINITY_DN2876_c1_g1_i11:406-2016(-)